MPPSQTANGRTIWNDKVRSDLLQAVLGVVTPTDEQWTQIQPVLAQMGYNYTLNAALQHLQKLKRSQGNGGGGSAPATPTPKRARAPASGRSSAKKGSTTKKDTGSKGYPIDLEGDEDDSDYDDHTAKKRRVKAEADGSPVKKEAKTETKPGVKPELKKEEFEAKFKPE
ncbi:hypothetical protein SLS62_002305 [Diatrype stigma]|uniref:Uncharacterized protein n=1 Tax=Diatrype stigma TaxID=117547 RepID=A0AAN9UUD4_9PEZI